MTVLNRVSRISARSGVAAMVLGSLVTTQAVGNETRSIDSQRAFAAELRNQAHEEGGWTPDIVRRDNSSLRMTVLMQARYMVSNRQDGVPPGISKTAVGFVLPRTQLSLEGNIVSSRLSYKLTIDFGDAETGRGRGTGPLVPAGGGTPVLLDAYAQYNFEGKRSGYYLKAGQFRHIMHTEEAVDAQYQLAVDRSLTNEFFSLGYTQGVALGRVERDYAWQLSINDGGRFLSAPEIANSSIVNGFEADFSIDARVDWKLKGSWEQFVDFTSFQGSQTGFRVGAGVSWMHHGNTNPSGYSPPLFGPSISQSEVTSWTIDAQYEGDGWNVFAAAMGNYIDWQFTTGVGFAVANYGFVVQGGFFATQRTEYFARFEGIFFDDQITDGFGAVQGEPATVLTVGMNYFVIPESHAAKFTVDVSYANEETSAFLSGVTSSDLLPDPTVTGFLGGGNGEIAVRGQFQILF